ncbi:MAG: hypothetical protein IKB98_03390 [Clostridia bacterium]|nr:hypothetical protein [Clostridia bacterium]
MKKRLLAIASFIMALVMSIACLGGCNLVTIDSDKDMEQVVATVSIESGVSSKLYKQELIMDYLNYGYQYVQAQGYTMEQALELVIDSRVNTMILTQYAMKYLDENGEVANSQITDKWNPERYLSNVDTADDVSDINQAKYTVYNAINSMLDSFATEGDSTKVGESSIQASRATPTGAAVDTEVTKDEKLEVLADGFDIGPDAKRREAFNKFINFLKINNLLGNDYKNNDITTTAYYKENLQNAKEAIVLEKFEEAYKKQALEELNLNFDEDTNNLENFDDAKVLFEDKKQDQMDMTNEEFVTALKEATAQSPVLYGAYGTYGYVYNLLLGIDDVQTSLIGKIDASKSDSEKALERADILATTRIKDLRASWVEANYEYDEATKKFGGDYTFTSVDNSLPFQGDVEVLKAKTDDEDAEYRATAPYIGLDQFIRSMNNYMKTGTFADTAETLTVDSVYNTATLAGSVKASGTYSNVEEYKEKINELLFAFSTDDGSLNTYKGYVIQPEVDAQKSEEYVATFAEAGRLLLSVGGQSYVIVASDFGYHVMFFSEVFNAGTGANLDLEQFLNANCDKGEYASWSAYYDAMMADFFEWEDTDNYLYVLMAAKCQSRVTNKFERLQKSTITKYLYQTEGAVEINTDSYADLLG